MLADTFGTLVSRCVPCGCCRGLTLVGIDVAGSTRRDRGQLLGDVDDQSVLLLGGYMRMRSPAPLDEARVPT